MSLKKAVESVEESLQDKPEKSHLYGPRPGAEQTDPTPLQIPVGFRRPETLAEQVQRLVRGSLSHEAHERGFETFEEANDFDIPDDPVEPDTPYEEEFDPLLGRGVTPDEFQRNPAEYHEAFQRSAKELTRAELFEAYGIDPDDRPGLPSGEDRGGSGQGTGAGAAQRATGALTADGGETPPKPSMDSTPT